jgi:hypothetical protein
VVSGRAVPAGEARAVHQGTVAAGQGVVRAVLRIVVGQATSVRPMVRWMAAREFLPSGAPNFLWFGIYPFTGASARN